MSAHAASTAPAPPRSAAAEKRAAAEAAAALVDDGMLVGLGTGSTAALLIDALGARVAQGLRFRAVATSRATEAHARARGIAVEPFAPLAALDLAIDGIDEIDPELRAIKGAGGALLREKVVASAAARMVAIGDSGKPVATLGRAPVPVEVLDFARAFVASRVAKLGARAEPRGEVRTDQGNPLLDCHFGPIADPEALAAALQAIPGVLAHGLFLSEIDTLCVGVGEGARWQQRSTSA